VANWLKKLFGGGEEPPVADDPRGGAQSEEYRHADPRDLVEQGGTTMSGPGGAPQENLSVDERRELDHKTD
jgi:hypothetical protein